MAQSIEVRKAWSKRLKSFSRSGLSQRAWCEREGVSLAQFGYWRRQLSVPASGRALEVWCPVEVAPADTPSVAALGGGNIVIRVANISIEVPSGFDAATLRAVIQALDPISC